jgi:hypothetical protein
MTTKCEEGEALRHNKEASLGEHQHGVKIHLASGDD